MSRTNDYWLREAGLELLSRAGAIQSTVYHAIQAPFSIAPHRHPDLVQLDLIAGCKGRLFVRDRWMSFDSSLAHIAYPGQVHGYELEAIASNASVYNFKLGLASECVLIHEMVLPHAAKIGNNEERLIDSAEQCRQSIGDPAHPAASAAIQLLRLLSLWPRTKYATRSGARDDVDSHVEAAVSEIEASLGDPITVEHLAKAAGVSDRHLTRLFVAETGMTPARYATVRRLDRAKIMLMDRGTPVANIANELGFSSPATFTRWFRSHVGLTPSKFRAEPTVF